MKSYDLIPGKRYYTTAQELPRVIFREIKETFPEWGDGAALIVVENRGRLYLMGAEQIIREV